MSCSRHIVRNIDGTPQELKVRLAAMHLTGKATQWHHNYMSTRYGLFPSWTDYIIAISARFCELFDPLAELVALKQDSDTVVVVYLDKFETARMRLVLPEAHVLSIFLANMNPHLSLHTRQFEVTTISGGAKIAMLHESSLAHAPTKVHKAPFNPSQYHRSSKTPSSTPLLQHNETATDDQPEDTPVISINALNGSTSYNCMRMIGQYGKTKLHTLIDPRSTHNFVDINIANHIGCKLEPTKPMSLEQIDVARTADCIDTSTRGGH
ncbi:hypothetical protein DY000_02059509 [Brassica cretica]|uniref:Retrotransposon gag domain-containing protein n=1 Tax=Brassica cretica TaxID=69181 RepID=A0ABQ7B392_BRACR|nr:hypothetical protein DY000_02059509 [Brassica cretica]